MRLDQIKPGCKIFIDANICIYHFTGVSDDCTNFLSRCEKGELIGAISVNVLLEILHRLMMIEAVKKKLITPPNILKKLKKKPEKIKQLNEYFINTMKIVEMGVEVVPVSLELFRNSQTIRERYGMMVNDSLIVQTMRSEGITGLATNDDGFLRVDGLIIYKPTDIKL